MSAGEEVAPTSKLSDALKQIMAPQQLLGKKTMENEILKEVVEVMKLRKWLARSLYCQGTACERGGEVLGVARLNVAVTLARPTDCR